MKLGIREMLFAAIMLGLMICSYVFVLKVAADDREATRLHTLEKQKSLADLRQSTAGISDLEKKIQELQEAIRFFEKKLPPQTDIDDVLKEVSQMATKNSLQTRTIRTMKSERSAGYCEQPITMSLSGDFHGFYSFLLQLEKLPRITRLTQMKLEKARNDGEMQAQLTLSIFFEADQKVAASDR